MNDPASQPRRRDGSVYRPALTPALKKLLIFLIAPGIAVLGANSVYLAAITFLGYRRGANFETPFYLWMFALHLGLGLLLVLPFLYFAFVHLRNTRTRRNKRVKRPGYALLACCLGVIVTGLLMTLRMLPVESMGGRVSYWLHALLPVLCVAFYVMHRLYGPRIHWRWGMLYASAVLVFAGGMAALHSTDPRQWGTRGGGRDYFDPAEVRTVNDEWIPEKTLMMDDYCQKCHPDSFRDHYQSVHHFSSFNNPPYLFSVRETRKVMLERDGSIQGARFCAGCHDPVPLLSGAFDDPKYDDERHPTSQAGITCTVCHGITDVAGTVGNGNYTIEEPLHYPFAYSENGFLQWINNQLVKAKPSFHKRTFLKPLHKTAEFCAVCHKVNLPFKLNNYKEWLRGQNHYDNFLLSGVSGNGARSFYYPPKAEPNCNECHMPKVESTDFGQKEGKIHDHRVPGSNTAIPFMKGLDGQTAMQAAFLENKQVDIELFAVRENGTIDGKLLGPVRPELPELEPGKRYLLEVVLRTLKLGHIFTQGTADSNEVWVELTARSGDRVIGRSGQIDGQGFVDPWSHFVNALVLDKDGNRIDRRNAQDIFTPLYSHQMPPGAGQVMHYAIDLPADLTDPVEIEIKLNYRKFDQTYMNMIYGDLAKRGQHTGPPPELPIVVMARDQVVLPLRGGKRPTTAGIEARKPMWQRWRDYGIGLLLKGNEGSNKGQLRQAEEAFHEVAKLGRAEGWVDLARVHEKEGRLEDARHDLEQAVAAKVDATWTVNWLSGLIDRQNGLFDQAIASFEKVLDTRVPERGFDFSKDYEVVFELGRTQFLKSRELEGAEQSYWNDRAIATFLRVLELDSENLAAHYNLMLAYRMKGDTAKAEEHRRLHAKYKPDDNARDEAVAKYRSTHPAADKAAEMIVIYELGRGL